MTIEINTVSFVGAGHMGQLIAVEAAIFEYSIRFYDIDPAALEQAKKSMRKAKRRKKDKVLKSVTYHDDLASAVKDVDLVIEAVPEILELKKEIFTEIDKAAPPHAIIATNSSSIPVSKIEDAVSRKDKVLNLHFYQPIQSSNMVDIMRGTQTSDETFETGKKWIESINCVPLVVKKECLGFVFNRIWHAVKKECLKIWAGSHADIETVDQAWKIWSGMPLGPFRMMDNVGLDVVYDIEMSYYNDSGNPQDKPPQALKDMIDRGELGVKSDKGFYVWREK